MAAAATDADKSYQSFIYPNPSSSSSSKSTMLCFDNNNNNISVRLLADSASSSNNSSSSGNITKSKRKPKLPHQEGRRRKKTKTTTKVRKEKLGERITALQQLVSPFGKTDTASVLHEAMGYIRFLHDQVQVLSSPYLQTPPSSAPDDNHTRYDLRTRGLCLVPLERTAHVTSTNGADFWSSSNSNY